MLYSRRRIVAIARIVPGVAVVLTLLGSPPVLAQQEAVGSFREALRSGTVRVDLRYRYEIVDEEGRADLGYASTLRTTLTYDSGEYHGFDFVLKAENVSDLGAGDLHRNGGFGSLGNDDIGPRPVIADPPLTALSEGFVRYRNGGTSGSIGRQEIRIGDQRFVGNVGWRQHHQTYRALRVTDSSVHRLSLGYAFVDRVYRVNGRRDDGALHLLHAGYELPRIGTLTGYAWLLDFEDAASLSTHTFGAELKGAADLGDGWSVPWELEYATQSDAGDNPARVDADYFHASAGVGRSGYRLRAGWERLEGEPGRGSFTTTLATLHAFNGWADVFLATPGDGLDDLYLRADGPIGPLSAVIVYHDFSASSADTDYGTEIDFQLHWTSSWEQLFGFRGAFFDSENFGPDRTKIWLYSTYSF